MNETMNYYSIGLFDLGMVGDSLTYASSQSLEMGTMVEVPVQNRSYRGVVLGLTEKPSYETKEVTKVIPHSLGSLSTPLQAYIARRMASYYMSPFHRVVRSFVPDKIWHDGFKPKRHITVRLADPLPEVGGRSTKLLDLISALAPDVTMSLDEAKKRFSSYTLGAARKKGIIVEEEGALKSVLPELSSQEELKELTKEQQELVATMSSTPGRHVLHAVTGAGKTEMYLRMARHVMAQGKQVLVLVPEIALTPQLLRYFQTYSQVPMSVFHSHLSAGEKQQEWVRVQTGHSRLILGSRSSIFAPFQHLGMIIIDEEQEWTYKNEQHPRYHARTVAEWMCEWSEQQGEDFWLILGSATPSVEAFHAATVEKRYHYHSLRKRIYEQTPLSSPQKASSVEV